jgi:hypothetical protein
MRESPQLGNGYLLFSKRNFNSVKTPLTRGQLAWALSSSETQRSAFSTNNLLLKNDKNFINWLVGITDGDGTFSFYRSKKNVWTFCYQVSQSSYNLRLLYYMKQKLKIGSLTVIEKNKAAIYRVRNKEHLIEKIIPIFDTHPLLTSKHFKYVIFKKALLISNDFSLSMNEKDVLISTLKESQNFIPRHYKSPVWYSKKVVTEIMTKFWLVGFVEAEGSFFLVKKGPARLVHVFELTQKSDEHVLLAISLILNIETGVIKKKTYYTIVTSKKETIDSIISYFFKTMKGMKSLEYRIWARSFNKRNRGFEYLLGIQQQMHNIRSIRFNKYWKKVSKKK